MPSALPRSRRPSPSRWSGALPVVVGAALVGCAGNAHREDKTTQALREQVEQIQSDYDRLAERVSMMESRAPTKPGGVATPSGLPVVKLLPANTPEATASSEGNQAAPGSPPRALAAPELTDDAAERLVISGTGADLKATEPKTKTLPTRSGTP